MAPQHNLLDFKLVFALASLLLMVCGYAISATWTSASEVHAIESRVCVLETLAMQTKDLPLAVERQTVIMERIDKRLAQFESRMSDF